MPRIRLHLLIWLLVISVLPFVASAQNYLGASEVLRQAAERNAKEGAAVPATNAAAALRDDLKKFRATVTNLPPAQAAQGWLALVDRARKIPPPGGPNFDLFARTIAADELFDALPPPADWNELARAIAARPPAKENAELPDAGLRFLADTLTGDAAARQQEIAKLQAKAKDADIQTKFVYQALLQQLSQTILEMSDDPDAILTSLERQMAPAAGGGAQQIAVPNLVARVGPEKAEAFLRKALVRSGVALTFQTPNETSRLAQKLALELMDQIKTPQWGLVNTLDSIPLYEALDKRFPSETNQPGAASGLPDAALTGADMGMGMNDRTTAQIYYMLALVSKDRPKDAAALARNLGSSMALFGTDEAFKEMERAGYAGALDNFFYELLSQDPSLPFWDRYVSLAAQAGTTDRMLALARSSAARQDFSDKKKAAIGLVLYRALLAADQVDEGVAEMRRLMALEKPPPGPFGAMAFNNGELGVELARLGLLLQKPDWTQEGAAAVKKWLMQSTNDQQNSFEAGAVLDSMADILFQLKQGPEAEAMLTDALAVFTRGNKSSPVPSWQPGNPAEQTLAALAVLYHKAGRQQDVLALLEQSPDWGVGDVSQLFDTLAEEFHVMNVHVNNQAPLPIPYLAADALIAAGRKDEAGKIVDELLNVRPGLDRGYELLLALKGNDAIPRLDELFARDQFEERPLIWKAHLLRQQNKLAEAEAVARKAISIDPSDGEEGRGDRMRAYAELAEIRDAQGEKKDADFYRQIVKSIRMSEDADEFYKAGLLKHAIPMYEQALTHFSDAYCIQSRLAVQLAGMGQNQEAEEHYRRAYELMPDSFGRVESHCFGCERVFEGQRAQNIAEKVFVKLAAARPDKPQVHYLLGYLREEEERYSEALTNYQTAVRLDPNYLNAWIKLDGVSQHVALPPKERDAIVFNILRLDPLRRHGSVNFQHVTDLAGLWNVAAATAQLRPVPATNLFALSASKAALEKKKGNTEDQTARMMMMESWQMNAGGAGLSPGQAVGSTAFVNFAGQMMTGASGSFMGDQ